MSLPKIYIETKGWTIGEINLQTFMERITKLLNLKENSLGIMNRVARILFQVENSTRKELKLECYMVNNIFEYFKRMTQ